MIVVVTVIFVLLYKYRCLKVRSHWTACFVRRLLHTIRVLVGHLWLAFDFDITFAGILWWFLGL
jgi:hypothetical protein